MADQSLHITNIIEDYSSIYDVNNLKTTPTPSITIPEYPLREDSLQTNDTNNFLNFHYLNTQSKHLKRYIETNTYFTLISDVCKLGNLKNILIQLYQSPYFVYICIDHKKRRFSIKGLDELEQLRIDSLYQLLINLKNQLIKKTMKDQVKNECLNELLCSIKTLISDRKNELLLERSSFNKNLNDISMFLKSKGYQDISLNTCSYKCIMVSKLGYIGYYNDEPFTYNTYMCNNLHQKGRILLEEKLIYKDESDISLILQESIKSYLLSKKYNYYLVWIQEDILNLWFLSLFLNNHEEHMLKLSDIEFIYDVDNLKLYNVIDHNLHLMIELHIQANISKKEPLQLLYGEDIISTLDQFVIGHVQTNRLLFNYQDFIIVTNLSMTDNSEPSKTMIKLSEIYSKLQIHGISLEN